MFVRGVDRPIEFDRVDNSFYKGIVVANNDPLQMFRVKIYIPELSNQPWNKWLADKKRQKFELKNPGTTNSTDTWEDEVTFQEVVKYLPWAEPSFPLMGEGGTGYYYANSVISKAGHITDSNNLSEYLDDFCNEPNDVQDPNNPRIMPHCGGGANGGPRTGPGRAGSPKSDCKCSNWKWGTRDLRTVLKRGEAYQGTRGPGYINEGWFENNPMTHINGSFSPSYFYEAYETRVSDDFATRTDTHPHINPYAYEYRPSTFVNKTKGVFGVPNVGTKVWVFHYNGDVNLPVYFGVRHDYREAYMINELDASPSGGLDYPGYHENASPGMFGIGGKIQPDE